MGAHALCKFRARQLWGLWKSLLTGFQCPLRSRLLLLRCLKVHKVGILIFKGVAVVLAGKPLRLCCPEKMYRLDWVCVVSVAKQGSWLSYLVPSFPCDFPVTSGMMLPHGDHSEYYGWKKTCKREIELFLGVLSCLSEDAKHKKQGARRNPGVNISCPLRFFQRKGNSGKEKAYS